MQTIANRVETIAWVLTPADYEVFADKEAGLLKRMLFPMAGKLAHDKQMVLKGLDLGSLRDVYNIFKCQPMDSEQRANLLEKLFIAHPHNVDPLDGVFSTHLLNIFDGAIGPLIDIRRSIARHAYCGWDCVGGRYELPLAETPVLTFGGSPW